MTIELDVRFRFSSAGRPLTNEVCVKHETSFTETAIQIGSMLIPLLASAINIFFGS